MNKKEKAQSKKNALELITADINRHKKSLSNIMIGLYFHNKSDFHKADTEKLSNNIKPTDLVGLMFHGREISKLEKEKLSIMEV